MKNGEFGGLCFFVFEIVYAISSVINWANQDTKKSRHNGLDCREQKRSTNFA